VENARPEKAGPDYRVGNQTARLGNAATVCHVWIESAKLNSIERRKCKNEPNRIGLYNYTRIGLVEIRNT